MILTLLYQSDPFKLRKYTCRNKECKSRYEKRMVDKWITWCSDECRVIIQSEKALKNLEKIKKEKWKETKTQWSKDIGRKPKKQSQEPLQQAVNKIACLIDAKLPCMARSTENISVFEGGHMFGVGKCAGLRYHLWNIHKQGKNSNRSQKDDKLMEIGFVARYGQEKFDWIESQREVVRQFRGDDKKIALKEARSIIRNWDKEQLTRDEVNERLGLYK